MFRITIEELKPDVAPLEAGPIVKVYEQSVEALDLRRVIDAINFRPRVYKPRAKKGGEQA